MKSLNARKPCQSFEITGFHVDDGIKTNMAMLRYYLPAPYVLQLQPRLMKIGKLDVINAQIASLVQIRDELQQALQQIRKKLDPPKKQRASKSPQNGLKPRQRG